MVYLFDPYFFRKMSKTCTNPECKQKNPQPISEFHKCKANADGLKNRCKACRSAVAKKKYEDPAVRKRIVEQAAAYYQTEEGKKKRRIWDNAQVKNSWQKLRDRLGSRLRDFVIVKNDFPLYQATMGCTCAEIRAHIEDQFEPWMEWANYGRDTGVPNKTWNFDHTIPYKAFPTVEELEKHHKIVCWYKNVRPLCANKNASDGSKYKEEDKQDLIRRFQLFDIEREVLALI